VPDVVRFRLTGTDPRVVVPEINGVSLLESVTVFEVGQGFTPAGGYGGLVPAYFDFGDLATYLLGRNDRQWPSPGRLWLLACECGEVGCWPFEARVVVTGDLVVWADFRQPNRSGWSYAGLGPFVFDRDQYDAAASALVEALAPTS
jgi:hypothetical protein